MISSKKQKHKHVKYFSYTFIKSYLLQNTTVSNKIDKEDHLAATEKIFELDEN